MTAEARDQVAAEILRATHALNAALQAAAELGLKVEIERLSLSSIRDIPAWEVLQVQVFQPLPAAPGAIVDVRV